MIYESYVNSRAIDDTGSSTPADYEGVLPPGAIITVENIPYLSSRAFRIKNKGGDFVHVCLSNDPLMFQGVTLVVVGGGQSSTFNPDPSANFLLMQNVGPLPAEYEVRVEE